MLLVEFKKNILRSQDIDKKTDKKIELSKDQKTAYNRIEKKLKKKKHSIFLMALLLLERLKFTLNV